MNYFVQSNSEYHDLISFLLGGRDVSGTNYLVFSEDVRSADGRVFHMSGGYLLALNFLFHASDLEVKLDRVGLNSNSLVDLYKIVCEDDDPLTKAITITESAESFIWGKELRDLLSTGIVSNVIHNPIIIFSDKMLNIVYFSNPFRFNFNCFSKVISYQIDIFF